MGNLNLFISTAILLVEDDALHSDKINKTSINLALSNRNLKRNRIGIQSLTDSLYRIKEIRSGPVHLIDISDARHTILVCLTPHRF